MLGLTIDDINYNRAVKCCPKSIDLEVAENSSEQW